MPFNTAFEQRKEKITAIEVPQGYHPKIPPMAFHEEAMTIYQVAMHYEKELCEAGVNKELLLDIPGRIAASMEAQAQWLQSQVTKSETEQKWEKSYDEARKFYDELYQELLYFCSNAGISKFKERFKGGYVIIVGLIQCLNDFATIIRGNSKLLSDQGMDITKGEKAAQLCIDISELYAKYQVELSYNRRERKKVRNQALIYLSEAITHVQQVALFRFRNDPDIKRGFTCEYRRAHRIKASEEKLKTDIQSANQGH